MTLDPLRALRLKWELARDPSSDPDRPRNPGRDALAPRGTPRFVGQIASGGAMPNTIAHVFLVHPVQIEGDESEGAIGTVLVDPSRVIPVVIIGPKTPMIGDFVLAQSVGGRWVAELGGTTPTTVPCSPCAIPNRDLTVSWVNGQLGGGSAVLAFNGVNQWRSDCTNQLILTLSCQGGAIDFSVRYFPTGGCPDGSSQTCAASYAGPYGLTLVQQLCSPFVLTYSATVALCPILASHGFIQFTITL